MRRKKKKTFVTFFGNDWVRPRGKSRAIFNGVKTNSSLPKDAKLENRLGLDGLENSLHQCIKNVLPLVQFNQCRYPEIKVDFWEGEKGGAKSSKMSIIFTPSFNCEGGKVSNAEHNFPCRDQNQRSISFLVHWNMSPFLLMPFGNSNYASGRMEK